MATIMPHGVLFRGGAEKAIREGIVRDGIIEAIISLPQHLFYGTGIPACVFIINKDKSRETKDKILFINADAEYGEARAQNFLRPEDIEKISYVFENELEIPQYSRMVSIDELEEHEFNLNIRRHVDNAPEPEIEDVRAHLIGGIPKREVALFETTLKRYRLNKSTILENRDEDYLQFKAVVGDKSRIKDIISSSDGIKNTNAEMAKQLASWWSSVKPGIERFPGNNNLAKFRGKAIESLKKSLVPVGILDEFQVAGIFVNWWQDIKWDLKTIVASGWSPSLIPDKYIIEAYFQKEQNEIDEQESQIAELDAELQEFVTEVEIDNDDDDNNKKVTAAAVKRFLKAQVAELKGMKQTAGTKKDIDSLNNRLIAITDKEKEIRAAKKTLKELQIQLWKLIREKRESFTEEEAKTLILKRLNDDIAIIMRKYLGAEERRITNYFVALWDKYQQSMTEMTDLRASTSKRLNDFLKKLGYVE